MSDSPPSTPKAATGIAALSVRETEVLGKAWSCLKTGPPEIDYEKLAKELNMANHRSASNLWSSIKKKMAWNGAVTPASAKSTGTKRKKAATSKAAAANDSEDDDENDSPAPKRKKVTAKPKATPRKKPAPKAAKVSDDDEEGTGNEAQEKLVKAEPQVKAEPEAGEEKSGDDVV